MLTYERRVRHHNIIADDFTRGQQVEVLAYVMKLIDMCLGHSARDTHRAYALGAKILGLKYKHACRIFKNARLLGPEEAVRRDLNAICLGEEIATIYVAMTDDKTRIKIGHSASPSRRIRTVEWLTNTRLTWTHEADGFMLQEHILHLAFRAHWLGGEWFEADGVLRDPFFAKTFKRVGR